MIKLTRYAMGQPLIAQVVSTHFKSVQFASGQYVSWTNTNSLLDKGSSFYLPEAVGGKTGTTEDAGYCVIAVIRRGGKTYYCAAMGCKQPSDRYRIVHSILKSKLGI
jgi:D-alanyl-D-alanine carboxypeptidase (penicillin-binding protein 5/6)